MIKKVKDFNRSLPDSLAFKGFMDGYRATIFALTAVQIPNSFL